MPLPANGYFTDPTTTNGEAKTAWDDMLEALNDMPETIGDVTGPASSVSGNIPTFGDTSGKLVSDSGVAITSLVPLSGGSLTGALNLAMAPSVASSSTTNIWGAGNSIHVTGTTAITSLGTAPQAGAKRTVIFDGVLTLTNGANLILPAGVNITTAAGDSMEVLAETTTQHRVVRYTPASGLVRVGGGFYLANPETLAAFSADRNNLAVSSTTNTLRISGTAARSVTGITGGSDGRILSVQNVGSYDITLVSDSTSSSASNRITGGDVVIPPGRFVILQYDGATLRWKCTSGGGATAGGILHVREEQASGTNGGTFLSGADRTRVLNTVVTNTIAGASLSSNQITVPAGTYDVFALAPSYNVNANVAWLYDVGTGLEILRGISAWNGSSFTYAIVHGRVTFAASKTIELRHRCTTTGGANSLGIPNGFGTEVYSSVIFTKVA